MANEELKNMNFVFNVRSAPRRGPTSADDYNDCLEEIATDLASLSSQWNNRLVKITEGLPNGSEDTAINAFLKGLDASNCWVDQTAASTSDESTYYDATNDRPLTIKEALDALHTRVTNAVIDLEEEIASSAAALTTAEKAAIGMNIFDPNETSSSTSLDGLSENSRLNLIQLATDLYGGTYSLGNDGAADLTYSVMQMVDALLEAHNGNWSDDITVDHTGISISLEQSDIDDSDTEDDSFTGTPTNLEDDLNQIRTEIKEAKGTATWTVANTALYAGGSDDLEGLLTNEYGTGVKAAGNPWGYDLSDLDGLDTGLDELTSTAVGSGLPTDIPDAESAQDLLSWMCAADMQLGGVYFRRMDTGMQGQGPFIVYHGRGSYPIVQLVQISPSVTTSGQYTYTVEHNNLNQFTLTMPAGVALSSGVIVSVW